MRKPISRTPEWLAPVGVVAGVALLVGVFLVIRYMNTPAPPRAIDSTSTTAVVAAITSLPASELDQVGLGSATNPIKRISGSLLTDSTGKPVVFYLGAEFCPFCAFERWGMIIALSRFGTFSGLQATTSSATDAYPNTPTFTFRNATFTSHYIDFQPIETSDRNGSPLQSPTAAQQALLSRYDTSDAIPFVDFGNQYAFTGATYTNPGILDGMSWSQIAAALEQPGSAQAMAILGSANLITAATCQLTGQQPASVCSRAIIQAIEAKL
ncbi:MAG TPA: DUF929 family protein [Candidatus Dormibacteraeota bacterium]